MEVVMNKQYKISLIGRIIAVIASIFAIVMVSGEWLDLYQVPMIFGNSIPHEYSLFDISDFLETFNMYLDNADLEFYSTLFSVGATVTIVLSVLTIILALINTGAAKSFSGLSATVGIIIAVVFLVAIYQINAEMKEATYGGVEELLRSTSKPYWLIAFSILSCIGCGLKQKGNSSVLLNNTTLGSIQKKKCDNCGAEIAKDSAFCNSCGTKVTIQTQSSSNNKFCTNCGAKIPEDATFCTECGSKL